MTLQLSSEGRAGTSWHRMLMSVRDCGEGPGGRHSEGGGDTGFVVVVGDLGLDAAAAAEQAREKGAAAIWRKTAVVLKRAGWTRISQGLVRCRGEMMTAAGTMTSGSQLGAVCALRQGPSGQNVPSTHPLWLGYILQIPGLRQPLMWPCLCAPAYLAHLPVSPKPLGLLLPSPMCSPFSPGTQ